MVLVEGGGNSKLGEWNVADCCKECIRHVDRIVNTKQIFVRSRARCDRRAANK